MLYAGKVKGIRLIISCGVVIGWICEVIGAGEVLDVCGGVFREWP